MTSWRNHVCTDIFLNLNWGNWCSARHKLRHEMLTSASWKSSVPKLMTCAEVKLSFFSNVHLRPDVGGQQCPCPVLVSFLSGFPGKSCPVSVCSPESVRIFPFTFLTAVRILSEFYKKSCPVSVCPAEQGRDRTVQSFTVLVRRRLVSSHRTVHFLPSGPFTLTKDCPLSTWSLHRLCNIVQLSFLPH